MTYVDYDDIQIRFGVRSKLVTSGYETGLFGRVYKGGILPQRVQSCGRSLSGNKQPTKAKRTREF